MFFESAEYESIYAHSNRQHRNFIHVDELQFSFELIGSAGLGDCKRFASHVPIPKRHEGLRIFDQIAKSVVIGVGTYFPDVIVHLDQAATMPYENRQGREYVCHVFFRSCMIKRDEVLS